MNVQDIKDLMAQFDESSLMEMSLKIDEVDVSFSKRSEHPQTVAYQASETVMPATNAPAVPVETALKNQSSVEEGTATRTDVDYIVSPLVGIVYIAPSPEDDPYVQVGTTVSKGQTVCIVEAMKLMNEIQSDFTGEIVEILIQNGQMVDFNQPLFAVKK